MFDKIRVCLNCTEKECWLDKSKWRTNCPVMRRARLEHNANDKRIKKIKETKA